MKVYEAEHIISQFKDAVASGHPELVFPQSRLNHSKGTIRTAFETYIKGLIEIDMMSDDLENNLINLYAMLDHFIGDEEAKKINEGFKNYDPEVSALYLKIKESSGTSACEFRYYINRRKDTKGQYPELADEYYEGLMRKSLKTSHLREIRPV